MTKALCLNDLQLILLSHASQRENGSLLPVPEKFAMETDRIDQAIAPLLKRQLVEESPVEDRAQTWRDDDQRPVGLFITAAGRALIAADDAGAADGGEVAPAEPAEPASAGAVRGPGKTQLVLVLLCRPEGAILTELTQATGWLPHTTRAALTGLRKKGHVVERAKRGDITCYHIAAAV
jgi:DNA-binding MarR family transcriptional regulator